MITEGFRCIITLTSCLPVCGAETKVLRTCLLWACFLMVPHLWFRVSISIFQHQVFTCLSCLLVTSVGAVQVMFPGSCLRTCPKHLHLLMMTVSRLSGRQQTSGSFRWCWAWGLCSSQVLLRTKNGKFVHWYSSSITLIGAWRHFWL